METMNENCTVYRTMDYLAKKWTIMILLELYKGEEWKRFSDLRSRMKEITPKVLSERLKELVDHGLVENRVDSSVSPVIISVRTAVAGDFDAEHLGNGLPVVVERAAGVVRPAVAGGPPVRDLGQ